jgi:hypothetical protein
MGAPTGEETMKNGDGLMWPQIRCWAIVGSLIIIGLGAPRPCAIWVDFNEARAATQAGLTLNPTLTISRLRAVVPSDNPTYLAQRERIYDGMLKAGMPEG